MEKYKTRADVPEKYKWDLTEFYKNDEEFNQDFDKASKLVQKIKEYVGCTKSSQKLYEFLKIDKETETIIENLYCYAYLINDQELGNSISIERKAKTEKLYTDYGTSISFFEPELLSLSKDDFNKLVDSDELKEYKVLLEKIYRYKDHILSESEEIIINELTNTIDNFEDMSSTMLNMEHDYGHINVDGKEEQITATNLRRFLKNDNRSIRKEAREKAYKVIEQYGVSSAQFLDSYVKTQVTINKIRKYESSFGAKRFSLNIPNEAFEALVSTVEKHVDSYQKYLKLLKKARKLDDLYQYDLSLSLIDSKKEYSIEDAWDLCLNAVKPLGDDYYNKFKKIIDNHYIDYAEYKGKCSGGYSFATQDKDSRILMSYNYNLDSVSTIAHEGGHNVHHQYVKENNRVHYRSLPSIVCEVASLTNECLLSNYLANNGKTKEEKLAGLSNIIDVINSNLFGAVREGKLEQEFYQYVENGGTITKDYMDKITSDSYLKYYGNEVNKDDYMCATWERRSHYYMFFYLYAYAFSISVALYVAGEILNGNKEMLDNYLKFLSTGSDKWALDIFKVLDIDLCSKDVYEEAIKYYDSIIDKYNEIVSEVEHG